MMRTHQLGFGALASAVLLAACGGGSSEPAATEETTETAAPAEEAAAPAEETAAAEPADTGAPAPDNLETIDGTTLADFTGSADAGETVFLQCKSCHVLEEGVNRIGPSLAGIIGREAGSVEGYNYTPANANSGITMKQTHG